MQPLLQRVSRVGPLRDVNVKGGCCMVGTAYAMFWSTSWRFSNVCGGHCDQSEGEVDYSSVVLLLFVIIP